MLKKIIRKENLSRNRKDEIKYGVIGAELRARRLFLSRTLASLVKDVCSISYLCKLEKNCIKPNKAVLMELCSRVKLDENQTKNLIGIRFLLSKTIEAFNNNDAAELEKVSDEVKIFHNYRSKIILLIYCIFHKRLEQATLIDKDLMKVVSGMNDEDLKVYFVFHAVLSFYTQSFNDAIEDFEEILKVYSLDKNLSTVVYKYKMYSELKLNTSRILNSYENLKSLSLSCGDYNTLDNANYILALYYLQNEEYRQYSQVYKSIKNESYKYTLLILVKLIFNKNAKIKDEWLSEARTIAIYIYNYYKNRSLFIDKANELTDLDFDIDFSPIIVEYLTLTTDLDKYNFINNIVARYIKASHDGSCIKFFMKQYSTLCYRHTKYKAFYEFYNQVKDLI